MLENLQSKYIKDILERGTENSKIRVIDKVTTDFIPDYLENLKGSTLNLSTEIKSFAVKYLPREEELENKPEKPSLLFHTHNCLLRLKDTRQIAKRPRTQYRQPPSRRT
jgi:hypothetical protein